jgi:putative transcriptional regulator
VTILGKLRPGLTGASRNFTTPQSTVGGSQGRGYFSNVPADPSKSDSPVLLRGKLLIADPSLRDGTFDRSVILLTSHGPEEGAAGLILNHPTGKVVGDFLKGGEFAALRHLAVHQGGPVMCEQMTFSSFWWSRKLGLRWAMRLSAKQAAEHARRPGRIVRAFIGYSGWSAGQLENELRRHSWFPISPRPDLLGHTHDRRLWAILLRGMSPLHRILAEAPEHPYLN